MMDGRRQERKAVVIHRRPVRPERQPRREVALGDGRYQRPVLQFLVVQQRREGASAHCRRDRHPGDQPDEPVGGVHRRATLRVRHVVGCGPPPLPPPPNDRGEHEETDAQAGSRPRRYDVGQGVGRDQGQREASRRRHAPRHVGRTQAPAPPGRRPADYDQPGNPERYYEHSSTWPARAARFYRSKCGAGLTNHHPG